LLNVLIKEKLSSPVLDLGCGYGPIGLTLATFNCDDKYTLTDINENAVDLTKKNAEMLGLNNVEIFHSDGYQNIKDKYASIVINPPIRTGKQTTYQLYKQAKNHLIENGSLYIVIRKAQGANSARQYLMDNYAQVTMMKRSSGYHVYRADMMPGKGDTYGKN
jgi:16S rRNA (guanine1207-N2)-methyltransferase